MMIHCNPHREIDARMSQKQIQSNHVQCNKQNPIIQREEDV